MTVAVQLDRKILLQCKCGFEGEAESWIAAETAERSHIEENRGHSIELRESVLVSERK